MANGTPPPILVAGMHPGTLHPTSEASRLLADAEVLVGGRRQLAAWALLCGDTCQLKVRKQIPISGPLPPVLEKIAKSRSEGLRVAVLADGDPLYYGIARRLIEEFGRDAVAIVPNLTTLQVACAKLAMPWHDMETISLHGRTDFSPLFAALVRAERVAVFTDAVNDPASIARALLERGLDGLFMNVLEDLNTPQEIIRRLTPEEVWGYEYSPLNIVIIERSYPPEIPMTVGLPDHFYFHERGLITKQPVRAAGLAALNVMPDSTVWDVGAGCGSVAIEASTLAHRGRVFAIEKNRRRAAMIRENIRRMGAWTVHTTRGDMPGACINLPTPDRIFIGGGLGGESNEDAGVLETCCSRLASPGRIVLHCILLDSLIRAKGHFESLGWTYGITQLQTSTSDNLAGDLRFKAQNPVFILWAEKP